MTKIILRKDIASRKMMPKSQMLRIVKTQNNNVEIDWNNNLTGRGAYIAKNLVSIQKAQKNNALSRALKTKVADAIYEELSKSLQDNNE